MFLSRNRKHNVYPCKPPFKGSKLYRYVFYIVRSVKMSFNVLFWVCLFFFYIFFIYTQVHIQSTFFIMTFIIQGCENTKPDLSNVLFFCGQVRNFNYLSWDKDLFVYVEVLRPSQPNGVMSSVVSLPNHTFTGQT